MNDKRRKKYLDLPDIALTELLLGMPDIKDVVRDTLEPQSPFPIDPDEFLKNIIGCTPWTGQDEIVQSVRANRFTVVESGNGVGKTFIAAAIVCWWMATYDDAVVITTAPTWVQVSNLLWRQIRTLGRSAMPVLPGRILETPRWEISPSRYAIGISTRKATEADAASMQGYHSPHLLFIMDECQGVPRMIWQSASKLVTGDENRFLAIGNPTGREGPFWEATQSPQFKAIHLSCLDHPNVVEDKDIIPGAVSRRWVLERASEWGYPCASDTPGAINVYGRWIIPLPVFQSSVLGVAPEEREDVLIPMNLIVQCQDQWTDMIASRPVILGVDPARFGSAKSSIAMNCGGRIEWIRAREGHDVVQVAGWVASIADEVNPDSIKIDGIGIGAGVVDILRHKGYPTVEVSFSKAAQQRKRFSNLRTETYWNLRTAMRKGVVGLPKHSLLEGDLSSIHYQYDLYGRVELERKEEIEARLNRSVDAGDCVALTFALEQVDLDDTSEAATQRARDMREALVKHNGDDSGGGSRWLIKSNSSRISRWRIN